MSGPRLADPLRHAEARHHHLGRARHPLQVVGRPRRHLRVCVCEFE